MKIVRFIILALMLFAIGKVNIAFCQNPIIRNQFTADPTARVFNGKVYLFPSHDIPAPEDYARKDWFCMADYHVFSSEDLMEWTDHGVIIDQKDVPWGNPKAYSMWAPDCIEKDGKYYFFFPDAPMPKEGQRGGGFGIGVAIADNPEGPYTVVKNSIEGIGGIDPCVLLASDGNAYIYWGGGGLRAAKLKPSLIELAEDTPTEVRKMGNREMKVVGKSVDAGLPEGFKEGPFAFERNGIYYLTYPWVEDKTEALAYAMSDNPLGPFIFKGKIMEQSATGCWTNHHSIVEYKGQHYLFYHHNDYSPNFDKLRSARIDSLSFNADGTIKPVIPTLRGVGISDARKQIQIDRYSYISPAVSMDFLSADTLRRFDGWQLTYKDKTAYSLYNKVSFGNTPAKAVSIRAKAEKGAKLDIIAIGNDGKESLVATVKIAASNMYEVFYKAIKKSPEGIVDLKIANKDGREVSVDWITFE
ncbi:MAG: family 43 glycosylhydrolase [Prevotella sp.]|nr:family 43 glycosylhydrolase [Candidatus Prevotella equi]